MIQITHLIPTAKFVIEEYERLVPTEIGKTIGCVYNYARFLQRPLEIGMLVPSVDGVPLKEPSEEDYNTGHSVTDYNNFANAWNEYKNAECDVLFEGFEYCPKYECVRHIETGEYIDEEQCENSKIEDLLNNFTPDLIKLTPAALKEIYNT